ncbi:MAG: phage major capsid protein [Steroidobacter sp.]
MNPELNETIEKVGRGFEEFRDAHSKRLDGIVDRLEELEAKRLVPGRVNGAVQAQSGLEYLTDIKSGEQIPLLSHAHKLADLGTKALPKNNTGISFGRWLRAVMVGKHADDGRELTEELKSLAIAPDASGGYTVPTVLLAEFIDLLRSRLVLSQAGVRTVPMTSKVVQLAKVVSDPVCEWHSENGNLNASDPSFDVVQLNAKTITCLTKFSLELSQDSVNIETVLQNTIAGAMAVAIDAAGLGGTNTYGPSGVMTFAGRSRLQSIGALSSYDPFVRAKGALLQQNISEASLQNFIVGVDTWESMALMKTGLSGDKTALPIPPALQGMKFLATTGAPQNAGSPTSSVGFLANWSDYLFGIRSEIRLQILREAFLGSNLQLAILAYARCDFAPTRESSFVTLEDMQ